LVAAEGGYLNAQNELGYMFEFGEGVGKDLVKSAEWYQKGTLS
jgi:uncharacterized protein